MGVMNDCVFTLVGFHIYAIMRIHYIFNFFIFLLFGDFVFFEIRLFWDFNFLGILTFFEIFYFFEILTFLRFWFFWDFAFLRFWLFWNFDFFSSDFDIKLKICLQKTFRSISSMNYNLHMLCAIILGLSYFYCISQISITVARSISKKQYI